MRFTIAERFCVHGSHQHSRKKCSVLSCFFIFCAFKSTDHFRPGQEGAKAIAGTLFGDKNPGGRLPFTWAKHTGQLPIYYSIKPSGRGYAYNDDDGKPLFPFGYGLSYSSFEYSNLQIPSQLAKNDSLEVKFTLKNTGKVAGDEVAQLYMKDEHGK